MSSSSLVGDRPAQMDTQASTSELLDELPGKRKHEEASDVSDDSSLDDEDGLEQRS